MWEHTQKNLIVNSGLLILAKLMISDFDNAQIETIGFGDGTSSGSDAPSASDVILGSDDWFKKDLEDEKHEIAGAHEARIYWEVIYTPTITTQALAAPQTQPLNYSQKFSTVVGDTVAGSLGGPLIANCKGRKDNGSGHYTGTPNALIEKPWE